MTAPRLCALPLHRAGPRACPHVLRLRQRTRPLHNTTSCRDADPRPSPPALKGVVLPVARPSFWYNLLPKRFRKEGDGRDPNAPRPGEGSAPTVFYVLIFFLVGSQAMQLSTLRREVEHLSRNTEAKVALLKDIVRRIGKGEQVDVVRAFGTGDPRMEREWEEAMRELENTEPGYKPSKRTRDRAAKQEAMEAEEAEARAKEENGATVKMRGKSLLPRFY